MLDTVNLDGVKLCLPPVGLIRHPVFNYLPAAVSTEHISSSFTY